MSIHNLRKEKIQPGDVLIDRRSVLGNPWPIGLQGLTRAEVIENYTAYARKQVQRPGPFRDAIRNSYGKRLFCWCAPEDCHGRVIEQLSAELVTNQGETTDAE